MLEVLPFTLPSDVANALYTAGKGWSTREAHKGPAGPLGFVVFQWLWGHGRPFIPGTPQQMHCTERLGEGAALAHAQTTFTAGS